MIEETISAKTATPELVEVSLVRFAGYFLRLGTFGFGGPIALAGHMQQDLVDDRHWISKQDYVEGLALAQLAPGPLAAQLAIYLGYVRNGILGATAVAVAFVLPSFLMVLALSAAYVPLWRPILDASHLLWNRCVRNRRHRTVGLQADEINARQGQTPLGDIRHFGRHDGMDFARDRLAFPSGGCGLTFDQSDAHKSTGRDGKT